MAKADPTLIPDGTRPYETEFDVRFADVDGMRHVNNAKYLTYTEVCRTRFLKENSPPRDFDDMPFILARAEIDFLGAATMGDTVRVAMWVPRIGAKSWDFAYRMTGHDGRVYCTARTVQVGYDYVAAKTVPVPERYRAGLLAIATPEVRPAVGPTIG